MANKIFTALAISVLCIIAGGCTMSSGIDTKAEKIQIEKAVRDCIEWPFPEKNMERGLGCLVKDSSLFLFQPSSKSTIIGYDSFEEMFKSFFMDEAVQPLSVKIKDLRINLSAGGDVAWFSCLLDDIGEINGRRWEWINCRWTGVLQKTDGKWLVYQMHFSLPTDPQTSAEPNEEGK